MAFLRGYAAGFLFFVCTLFWIHHVTTPGLILLSAYLALYWAIFAGAAAWSSSQGTGLRIVFLGALWASLEFVRAELLSGFGWAALAHTQTGNLLFIQLADITGTYGLSFLMIAASVLIAVVARAVMRREVLTEGFSMAAWGVVLMLCATLAYGFHRLEAPVPAARMRVALIQPNVTLADYADPLLKTYVVEKQLSLSREALKERPDLILWPETAFPQFIWDQPGLFEQVRTFAREHKVKILLGAVTRTGDSYFNSALFIDAAGQMGPVYNKQHLVLFGEYIPLRKEFPLLAQWVPIDDFTPGNGNVLFPLSGETSFSTLICFEDTIAHLARRAVREGAGILVNITNDAWFGPSRQPRMHLDNAIFRAVENRRMLLRSTNTGMSCAVRPTGAVVSCVTAPDGRQVMAEGFSVMDVELPSDDPTFYTKYGDLFAMLCFLGILGIFIVMMRNPEA